MAKYKHYNSLLVKNVHNNLHGKISKISITEKTTWQKY